MLFNSYIFVFAFLPITLSVFYLLGRYGQRRHMLYWLILASLFFYGWWNPPYLFLLLASVSGNFLVGRALVKNKSRGLLALGVVGNVLLLGYYKYTDFFISSLNALADTNFPLMHIILPLAISFFTFQQIAFLVDTYRGRTQELNFLNYLLFVAFFPQLIAGPIVHHKEVMPQFAALKGHFKVENLAVGLTIFALGLFKKVILGDSLALYVNPVFNMADKGITVDALSAWQAASAFLAQIYFDFSGYSDMAIGLARMFGILLPLNFNSPCKSRNYAEFWNNWHITLTRFLRTYIFMPLTRKWPKLIHVNIMITMIVAGLWHGADWTFALWGFLLGSFIVLNNIRRSFFPLPGFLAWHVVGQATVVLLTIITIVLFRAMTLDGAVIIFQSMFGFSMLKSQFNLYAWLWIFLAYGIMFFAPNTQEFMHRFTPALGRLKEPVGLYARIAWSPTLAMAAFASLIALLAMISFSRTDQFIYFQF